MTQNVAPLALIIDDQQDIREIIRLSLSMEGWRVCEASNGREGIESARRETPGLIIIDLMMPEMTGIEFCRKLTGELHLNDTPVLLISGVNVGAKILDDFWEMPLRHKNFLHKPFGADELLRAVQGLTPRHKASPPGQTGSPSAQPRRAVPPEQLGRPVTPSGSAATTPTPPSWMQPAAQPPAPQTPPRQAAATPAPPAAKADDNAKGYRILVIDDDDDIRMILKTGLGFYHNVETAHNGMVGLEKLDQFRPDFIICDINMPVMNGLETVEAIRRHPQLGRVPVFFLTGETDASLPRRAFDIGANLYLRKPADPIRLLKNLDYFIKETGLKAGGNLGHAPGPGPAPVTPPAATTTGTRIMTVDFNIENHRLLQRLFEKIQSQGLPLELLWTEDAYQALGNLPRWEPDLILYNPRHPKLDGVAFGQSLLLRKASGLQEVAFIGTRFYESEVEYSRQTFKRGVIGLDEGEESIARKLNETIQAARARMRPKQMTFQQIQAEEAQRLGELNAASAKQDREREIQRQRYAGIQAFIDKQFD